MPIDDYHGTRIYERQTTLRLTRAIPARFEIRPQHLSVLSAYEVLVFSAETAPSSCCYCCSSTIRRASDSPLQPSSWSCHLYLSYTRPEETTASGLHPRLHHRARLFPTTCTSITSSTRARRLLAPHLGLDHPVDTPSATSHTIPTLPTRLPSVTTSTATSRPHLHTRPVPNIRNHFYNRSARLVIPA